MRKLFIHLSILCLLAALLVPMVGCKKDANVEESPATTMEDTTAPIDTMGTDMGTTDMGMGTDMGTTDMGTTGTDMTPPAQ